TTMAVWMGLTFNCAQCHDHKYDPFSQEEFFRLFSFFNQTEDNDQPDDRPFQSIYTEEQKKQKKDWEDDLVKLQATLDQPTPELEEARRRWEAALAQPVAWKSLKAVSEAGEDGFVAAAGKETSLKAQSELQSIAAVRVESIAYFA